jgi:hypothetical protein
MRILHFIFPQDNARVTDDRHHSILSEDHKRHADLVCSILLTFKWQRQLRGGLKPHPTLQKLRVVLETGCETLCRARRGASGLLAVGAVGYGDDVPNVGYCDGR